MQAVLSTYLEICWLLIRRRALLVRFGVVLCLVVTGFWALCTYVIGWTTPGLPIELQSWFYYILGLWFSVLLAVRWHRLVLLGERHAGVLNIWPGRRELLYFAWFFLLSLAVGLVFYLLVVFAAFVGGGPHSTLLAVVILTARVAALPVMLARLGLLLPAAALDRPMNLRESWDATAGRGLPFFALIFLLELPLLVFDLVLQQFDIPDVVSLILYMAVWWVTIAATATALSYNYAAVISLPNTTPAPKT